MGKPKPSPNLYKRARGYGLLADIQRNEERDMNWKPVPGYPEYEVSENRQVRRVTTHHYQQPISYPQRPNEGEFVEFWVDMQKHMVSLDTIMAAAFPKGES